MMETTFKIDSKFVGLMISQYRQLRNKDFTSINRFLTHYYDGRALWNPLMWAISNPAETPQFNYNFELVARLENDILEQAEIIRSDFIANHTGLQSLLDLHKTVSNSPIYIYQDHPITSPEGRRLVKYRAAR